MKSIKRKLFLAIILILSIFVLGVLFYSLLFRPYYINIKLSEMNNVISSIESFLPSNNLNNNLNYISEVSDKYNLQIQIVDNNKDTSIYGMHGMGRNGLQGNPNRFSTVKELGEKEDIVRSVIYDKSTNLEFLNATKINNAIGYTINIKTPISAINDSLHKSLELLSMILIPLSLFILFIVSYFARSFTKPIIAITDKAYKIENLDFTHPLNINSKDEIGILANTINNLSNRIETTLKELTDKNLKLEEFIAKEKKNEALRKEFVSSVSHELKTPITVISGYTQALQSGVIENDDDKNYYLNVINDETERMQVIVNDLLDLYKLESNTFKIQLSAIDLDILVNKILNKLSFKFEDLNIKLTTEIEKCTVLGDSVRLEQAIVNYINNAICHVDDKKEIEIRVIVKGIKVLITVFNTGEPIKKEDLSKIWSGFVRLDKVRNYKEKRVGLGLAIVEQIVRLHNGEKGVTNRENGVEFWISLDIYNKH